MTNMLRGVTALALGFFGNLFVLSVVKAIEVHGWPF